MVAFRTGGLVDIVDHRINCALAEPFDPTSLAASIRWLLKDSQRRHQLGVAARGRAERLWNRQRIAGTYSEVYQQAMAGPMTRVLATDGSGPISSTAIAASVTPSTRVQP